MNIRQQFPDEERLKNYFGTNIQFFFDTIRQAVGPLEAEYIKMSKRRAKGMKLIGAAVVCVAILGAVGDSDSDISGVFVGILALFALPAAIVLGRMGWNRIKGTSEAILAFNDGLNDVLYPLLFSVFGLEAVRVRHTKKSKEDYDTSIQNPGESILKANLRLADIPKKLLASPETDTVLALLEHSELITEPRNRVVVDDMVRSSYADRSLFISEVDVKHVTGSGKHHKVKKIFHGYFVSYDLPRRLSGKTFVSTEGDKKGFGHQSFWKSMSDKGVQKTELEWNDFEKKLHVVTSDPTESRYVLTPDFMYDLYNWWEGKKQNIRLAFISNRMYILFPDEKVRIGRTIKKIDSKEIGEYLESVGIPLLHVLHLVEDLEN
jgi:hypothetical protein